jgi:hypothetical protein
MLKRPLWSTSRMAFEPNVKPQRSEYFKHAFQSFDFPSHAIEVSDSK